MTLQRIIKISKITINPLQAGYRSSNSLNANFEAIEEALENTLSRDGTGPNQMEAELDMNGQRIINLPEPVSPTDALRLQDLTDLETVVANGAALRGNDLSDLIDKVAAVGNLLFQASGVGAVVRSLLAKLRLRVDLSDYGASEDGVTLDTEAWEKALAAVRPGGTIHLNGFSRVNATLVPTKPVNVKGGSREQSGILFDADGTYKTTPDGKKVGVWFPHSTTIVPGVTAGVDARRSRWQGMTIKPTTTSPADMRGVVISVVTHFDDVSVDGFSDDNIAILASDNPASEPTPDLPYGNANKSTLTDCRAYNGGGHGLHTNGNNANACGIRDFVAANNAGWGIREDSLLGNRYDGPECDSNGIGGYWTTGTKPNRSTFVEPYSETSTHFSLGSRTVIINPQGLYKPTRADGGVILGAVPSGGYLTSDLIFADTDDIANVTGDATAPGKALRLGPDGLQYRPDAGRQLVRLRGDLSANYVDLDNGGSLILRMAAGPVVGNLNKNTPWLYGGFVIGDEVRAGIVGAGSAPPANGSHAQGAIWLNDTPTVDANNMILAHWVSVGAGGTWTPQYLSTVSPAT